MRRGRKTATILDVVYNHYGPHGNVGYHLRPQQRSRRDKDIFGFGSDPVNYDERGSRPNRDEVLQSIVQHVKDFGVDALRLDAVDAIRRQLRPALGS
jgi:maltooligosyltrehalose trehalohydrolase